MATKEQMTQAAQEAFNSADEGGCDIAACWDAAIDAATAPLLEAVREACNLLEKGAFTYKCAPDFRLECEAVLVKLRPFMEQQG